MWDERTTQVTCAPPNNTRGKCEEAAGYNTHGAVGKAEVLSDCA
jgi:hypothetical protein